MDLSAVTYGYNGNLNNLAKKTEAAKKAVKMNPELCASIRKHLETAADLADLARLVNEWHHAVPERDIVQLLFGMGLIGTHTYRNHRLNKGE